MFEKNTLKQANEVMNQTINYEIERDYNGQSDVIDCVNKCKKHIKCLACLDTKRLLFDSESWFGGTYEEFSCPGCSDKRERKDSHHQIYHCQVNGRQVPYNGGSKIGYSRISEMVNIYKREYEEHDFLVEENERKKVAAELEAEAKRLEIKRIKKRKYYFRFFIICQ